MKLFAHGTPAKRKIVLIFLLAIFLPALVVGFLSLNAFSKRQEAVQRLLESNLWISAESALRSVEAALLEQEKEALKAEKFARLTGPPSPDPSHAQKGAGRAALPADIPGTPFLLDDEFQLIFPSAGSGRWPPSSAGEIAPESGFSRAFQRAETYEFSEKNFSEAAAAYRKCASETRSGREKALALEGLGRSLLSAGRLEEAESVYGELEDNFGRIQDQTGHFLGLTAAFQISEIEKRRKNDEKGLRALLHIYQAMKDGDWPISLSEYGFFTAEIESALDVDLRGGGHPEIQKSYQALQQSPSSYLETLLFTDFLKKDIVPKIKERVGVSSIRGGPQIQPDRLLANWDKGYGLVSFSPFPGFQERRTYYGGFRWDLEALKKTMLPEIFKKISKDTELRLENSDESLRQTSLQTVDAAKGSLLLSYRQFPLPWKLAVTQPALGELERTARRENFLYGALLVLVLVLMLLGAFLLGRDISRESETTRLKTEFVHNISHELKTPLTLIRLYGETLQRKGNLTDEEKRESYEIITKESERLSHLINNVLDFSRIDLGRKEFRFAPGSLSRVVQETLDSYRYHLEKKGFMIKEEIAPDLPEMRFDGEAVASALINLLSNAMKFSPGEKHVTVRLFQRNGLAVIQVEDKGIGISPRDQSRIFGRFYRADNEVVAETRGSGLGLTLVKHIAEAHGGTVEVRSEPGKGSIFSISLPIRGPETRETR